MVVVEAVHIVYLIIVARHTCVFLIGSHSLLIATHRLLILAQPHINVAWHVEKMALVRNT